MGIIIVTTFILAVAIIQIPGIQNKIVQYATSFASNKTHTRVEIKNISISFPKAVVIEGFFLEDLKKDTLLYAGKVKINIALFDLLSSKISINSFALDGVNLNLCRTNADSLFNFNFLLAAFSDTTNQTKVKPQSPSKWTFSIDRASLKNIRFHYDDEYGGMNVTALLGNLKLTINEIDFGKSIYGMDELLIESLKANVLIKKTAIVSEKKSDGVLPKIMVNKIRINNSTVNYGDSISNQSAIAVINLFELKQGSIGLQKEAAFEPPANNWKARVKSILLDADSLAYKVGNKPEIKNAFDANNLKYSRLKLEATDLLFSADTTEVSIKKISAIDQNNFSITKFETDFSMDQHSITAKNLKAKTANSSMVADLNIQFTSLKSLKDSIPFLILNLDLEDVRIKNSDVLYFNPKLIRQPFFQNKTNITTISGIVSGRVNKLKGKNMVIKTGNKTILKTDFSITGLPDMETAYFIFPNLKIISGKRDIVMMAGPSIPKTIGFRKI